MESSKAPSGTRVSACQNCPKNSATPWIVAVPASKPKPSPRRGPGTRRKNGADSGKICVDVENWGGYIRKWSVGTSNYRHSLLKVRLGRNHLLVQEAHDQEFVRLCKIEYDVFAMLKPAQPWMNRIAVSTDGWIISQELEAILEALSVPDCLGSSPGLHGVADDGIEIGFREPC